MIYRLSALAGAVIAAIMLTTPAHSLTMQECSAKYNAAKDADLLDGMTWNDFRKAECGPDASPTITRKKSAAKLSGDGATAKGLSMSACSDRYQAAKSAGTLRGMKWNDFRKTQCGAGADDDDTVPSFDEATYTNEPEQPTIRAPRGVRFPSAIARKYSNENPGKARLHTCLDQYYANKDADSLGGLRWIQKGGGYYSLCNARLRQGS
ncbi:MAG: antifreeze protein [Mesorhizobium sp.]